MGHSDDGANDGTTPGVVRLHETDRGSEQRPAPIESLTGIDASSLPTDAETSRHSHIVLLGLMGAGKSSVGLVVANELGRPFVDSDSIVALRTGRTPAELAELTGERGLHDVEATAARRILASHDSLVFAAAASAVEALTPDDLAGAWAVWLEASPDVLDERVRADGRDRPLLGDHPADVLTEHHRRRAPKGRRLADLTVDTDDVTVAHVAATICIAWRSWARRSGNHSNG
jgi:shikimate kinase